MILQKLTVEGEGHQNRIVLGGVGDKNSIKNKNYRSLVEDFCLHISVEDLDLYDLFHIS